MVQLPANALEEILLLQPAFQRTFAILQQAFLPLAEVVPVDLGLDLL